MTTLPPSRIFKFAGFTNKKPRIIRGFEFGAGNETRTRDPDLGKVVLYQLSYSRFGSVLDAADVVHILQIDNFMSTTNFIFFISKLRELTKPLQRAVRSGQAALR